MVKWIDGWKKRFIQKLSIKLFNDFSVEMMKLRESQCLLPSIKQVLC